MAKGTLTTTHTPVRIATKSGASQQALWFLLSTEKLQGFSWELRSQPNTHDSEKSPLHQIINT